MNKKIIWALSIVLVLAFIFIACAPVAPTVTGPAGKVKKLGFVHQTASWTMYQVMEKAVAEKCAADGVEFSSADPNDDANKQAQQIETMINSGFDAIIFVCIDGAVLQPAAKMAKEKGVTLIPLFTSVDGTPGQILVDEYQYGYDIGAMGAKYMAENFPGERVEVGLLRMHEYLPGIERGKGMVDALKDLFPTAVVVNDQPSYDVDTAMKATEAILAGNPDCRMFLTDSDDTGAIGAYQVLKAKVKPEDYAKYCVIGADGVPQAFEYIKEGGMYRGTVALLNAQIGLDAYALAVAIANGEVAETTKWVTFEKVDFEIAKAKY